MLFAVAGCNVHLRFSLSLSPTTQKSISFIFLYFVSLARAVIVSKGQIHKNFIGLYGFFFFFGFSLNHLCECPFAYKIKWAKEIAICQKNKNYCYDRKQKKKIFRFSVECRILFVAIHVENCKSILKWHTFTQHTPHILVQF